MLKIIIPKSCMSELINEFSKVAGFKIDAKNHIWKRIPLAITSK